jgi:3alpha(or 20beta)-hydroxysteroid dehydrogenase
MQRLDGKVALVSGGARGIGAAAARLLAEEGAAVVVGDILESEGQAVAREISELGGRASFLRLDVASESDWQAAVEIAQDTFGSLSVLFSNAGFNNGPKPVVDVSLAEWNNVLAVNLTGMFLGTRAAIPALLNAGGGSIINNCSVSGLVASGSPAYGAAKGGVRQLTKAIARQYAADNIRCNSLCPGPTDTAAIRVHNTTEDLLRAKAATTMFGRMAQAREIAAAVVFLASDESSFITGSELVVDGGVTAL